MPPIVPGSRDAPPIDSLLLRIGASVRAAQAGALHYEQLGEYRRARSKRRAGTRLTRAIVREALAAGVGDPSARLPEPEQLALDVTAGPAAPVEVPTSEAVPVAASQPEPLAGDTGEVLVVTAADSAPRPGVVRLSSPVAESAEVAQTRLPAREPGGSEPGPEAPAGAVVQFDSGLLERINAYTRVPAGVR